MKDDDDRRICEKRSSESLATRGVSDSCWRWRRQEAATTSNSHTRHDTSSSAWH